MKKYEKLWEIFFLLAAGFSILEWLHKILKPAIDLLAGIPSVVYEQKMIEAQLKLDSIITAFTIKLM